VRRTNTETRRVVGALATAVVAMAGTMASGSVPTAGAALPACTTTFVGAGDWHDASDWSTGTVPGPSDHVCIPTGTTFVRIVGRDVTVASLRLGGSPDAHVFLSVVPNGPASLATLTATQGIEITHGELILGGEAPFDAPGGTVRVTVPDGATIENGGTITSVDGSGGHIVEIDGAVVNHGVVRVEHDLSVADLTTDGRIEIDGATLTASSFDGRDGTLDGPGLLDATDLRLGSLQAGTIEDGGGSPLIRVTDGVLDVQGDGPAHIQTVGEAELRGEVGSDVHLTIRARPTDQSSLAFAGTLRNRGEIVLAPGIGQAIATLTGTGPGAVIENDGLLRSSAGGREGQARLFADIVNRGFVGAGEGSMVVVGDVVNDGLLDVHTGWVQVAGDLDLRPAGVLQIDVEAMVAGRISHGRGTTNLDGELEVVTTDPPPVPGASFDVLASGSTIDRFADVTFTGPASYDTQYGDHSLRLVRRAPESAARRFVRAAHQDFLGRQPTPTELGQRASAIEAGTLSRAALVRQLALSPEYVTALVQRFYADTLGRPGDPDGVAFWVDQLRTGRKTVAQVAGSFYASPEYFDRWNNTSDWVYDLYEVFFGRGPSGDEQTYWTERAHTLGRTRVATEMFQSLESRRQRVHLVYRDLLGRAGDPDGVDYWAGRVTREGDLALAVNLAASGEYLARAQTRYP
jgi:hypothetical protein